MTRKTVTIRVSTLACTIVASLILLILTHMIAYSEGLTRWTATTERSTQTASHWMDMAHRCYSVAAPALYLSDRGYQVLRASYQRRVVVREEWRVEP